MTIRVLLADDEPLILKGLRKLLPWEELGVEIVGQACDGDELDEQIRLLRPDVLISDISMPRKSGIDVLRGINEQGLPVKVVFISAYQEFSYAKEAISLGAVEYLIKPIEREQLRAALDKAMSLIREEGEENRRKDKLRRMETRQRTEEKREALSRLASGTLPAGADLYARLEAELRAPFYTVLALELGQLEDASGRWTETERNLVNFAVDNVLGELLAEPGSGAEGGLGTFFAKQERIVVIVPHSEAGRPYELAQDIKAKINDYLKLNVSIGIGLAVRSLGRLAESAQQAEQALDMKYFEGLNKLLPYAAQASAAVAESELYTLRSDVVQSLAERNGKRAQEALHKLLAAVRRTTEGNKGLAVATAFSSVLSIVQELQKSGVALSEEGFDLQGLQTRLGQYETFDSMAQGIGELLGELAEVIGNRTGNRDKMLLARIKQHIERHYADELTLESVAAVAFMNPYYFSAFFKKHTNENFKAYVTEVRMRHATQLLSNTDLLMYEVAEKVGYANARHFSDVFKKTCGMLPNEYRQSLRS
ncbi:response regulator [Cohnella fermenti]|uniref:Response regulator n=1 Tax=Cohnella fermenti TaxID=2565925 RepID=A0A4S4BER4_9BACL|nr:response regulator [Cohnella fermenti]THF72686.1 response regulator [Cohnella fermenti]